MARMIFLTQKNIQADDGNYIWNYKNETACQNVCGYVLNPPFRLIRTFGFGVPYQDAAYAANAFLYTQYLFRKTGGRRIRHEVLVFDSPDEYIDPMGINRIIEIAFLCGAFYYSLGFQTLVSVWPHDKDNQRNLPEIHFVINTVSFVEGHKYSTNVARRAEQKAYFNQIIQFYTKGGPPPVCPQYAEPDYSDLIYLPAIFFTAPTYTQS